MCVSNMGICETGESLRLSWKHCGSYVSGGVLILRGSCRILTVH